MLQRIVDSAFSQLGKNPVSEDALFWNFASQHDFDEPVSDFCLAGAMATCSSPGNHADKSVQTLEQTPEPAPDLEPEL